MLNVIGLASPLWLGERPWTTYAASLRTLFFFVHLSVEEQLPNRVLERL